MTRRRFWILFLVVLALLELAAFFMLFRGANLPSGVQATELAISAPADGSGVPLHSTVPVVGEANSAIGIRKLELWINGQQWGKMDYAASQNTVQQTWAWTPSGEGKHILLLRAQDAHGRTVESAQITIYASAQFDVRFPLAYTAHEGETMAGLADTYGTDPDAIAASNPDLDPTAPLKAGQKLTLPIPIANADPASPQDGSQPVAPAGPLPSPKKPAGSGGGGQSAGGALDLSMLHAIELNSNVITLKFPVQQIYAYVSLAGRPWIRIPSGPFTFLNSSGNTFDLKPYITPDMLGGLPSPTSFEAEVWGWSGGQLVYLGKQSGVLDTSPQAALVPFLTSTRLDIVGKIRDSVSYESEWTIPSPIPGYYQGFVQGFRWSSTLEGVTGGMWQVSTQPLVVGHTWTAPGLLDSGKLPSPKIVTSQSSFPFFSGSEETHIEPVYFSIDFSKYLDLPQNSQGGGSFFDQIKKSIQDPLQGLLQTTGQINTTGLRRSDGLLPTTFYVRVVPFLGSQVADPSNNVIVHYGPPEAAPITAESGPIYDVQVVSFSPYRPADSDYKACMVLTQDIKTCHTVYSLNLQALSQVNAHMQNVLKVAAQSGNLGQYINEFPGVIIASQQCDVAFPKGAQSCGCPGVPCTSGSSCSLSPSDWGTCIQEGGDWFLTQIKNASNWLSKKYEELKDLAVDVIMKYTPLGMTCKLAENTAQGAAGGKLPNDLCRTAFKVAVEAGLAAAGLPPSLPNFDELLSQGQDYLVNAAIQAMKDQGIECDSTCEDAIKAGYSKLVDGASNMNSGSGGGAGGGGSPALNWQPDPRGIEQPAVLMLRLTRRTETAGIPTDQIGACKLYILDGAANSSYGQTLEGAPFVATGIKIPPLEPGDSITVPMTLQRNPWNVPAGFSLPPGPGNSIQMVAVEADYGAWTLLYYGSTITFSLGGPTISVPGSDNKPVSVSCVSKLKYDAQIPKP